MNTYDEVALVRVLSSLSPDSQSAFAQACAWRALRRRRSHLSGDATQLCVEALDLAFESLARAPSRDLILGFLQRLEAHEELDDDAMAATAYVLRNILAASAEQAAFSARRAFEATDEAAQDNLGVRVYSPAVERALSAHPLVQAELAGQSRDLQELALGSHEAAMVVFRAKHSETL